MVPTPPLSEGAPVVDVDQLAAQLDAARRAREQVDRMIAWCEEGLDLFGGRAAVELEPPIDYDAGVKVLEAAAPADVVDDDSPTDDEHREPEAGSRPVDLAGAKTSPPALKSRAGARDYRAKVLAVVLRSNTALRFSEIHDEVGGSDSRLRAALQHFIEEGRIEARGKTSARRFKAVKPEGFHSEHRERSETTKARNAAKVADGIERVVFRDKVAKAIAGQAGLTAAALAHCLEADHDDVAEACAWLVGHHQVTVDDDGGHHRHATGRARLRAAA